MCRCAQNVRILLIDMRRTLSVFTLSLTMSDYEGNGVSLHVRCAHDSQEAAVYCYNCCLVVAEACLVMEIVIGPRI